MLAVRANERSAAGIGVNVTRVKIASFAISSFIAGIGGCLFAYRQSVMTFVSFTALGGLALLSTVYLAGITSVFGGILGGILASSGIAFLILDRTVHLGMVHGAERGRSHRDTDPPPRRTRVRRTRPRPTRRAHRSTRARPRAADAAGTVDHRRAGRDPRRRVPLSRSNT